MVPNARRWALALGVCCSLGSRPALANPGDLDPSFGEAGRLRAAFLSNHRNEFWDVAAQADGKLVVLGDRPFGYYQEWILFRYNIDGSLDTSFGFGGHVTTSFGIESEAAEAVAIQPDGKIVAAGESNGVILVARYLPDGSLDPSWSGDGRASFTGNQPLRAFDMALQADGKVVVVGDQENGPIDHFAVVRFTANGFRDFSFDLDGLATTTFPDNATARSVAIQSDGKILVSGEAELVDENDHLTLVRYLDNGALDPSFSFDGIVTLPEESAGGDLALQAGSTPALGRIVVTSQEGFILYRFSMDGSLDPTFGQNGKQTGPLAFDNVSAVRVLYDQGAATRIVVAAQTAADLVGAVQFQLSGALDLGFGGGDGHVMTNVGPEGGIPYSMDLSNGKITIVGIALQVGSFWDPMIVRYNANGTIDPSFDGDGIRTEDPGGLVAPARCVARQIDGKLVLAGSAKSAAGDDDFALLRCNADGTLDPSFGQGGRVVTPLGPANDIVNGIAIQSNGKIVVAGDTDVAGNVEIALARYNTNGTLDTSFSEDGIEITPGGPQQDSGRELALQSDGKIVVGGFSRLASVAYLAVWRYQTNGTLDYLVRTTMNGDGAAANTVIVQPDGKVFAAGARNSGSLQTIAGVRLHSDGTFDPTFDGDGIVVTTVPGAVASNALSALVLPDGRIVVAGITQEAPPYQDAAVVRYLPNGALDTSFSEDGIASFTWGSEYDYAQAMALEPNGKLVIAGSMGEGLVQHFALLRLLEDGSLDPSYGTDGKVHIGFDSGSWDTGLAMTIGPDGNAVVAGDAGGVFGALRVLGDAPTSVLEWETPTTFGWQLGAPWPNPTRAGTSIALHLRSSGSVAMTIFDVRGRLVRALQPATVSVPGDFSLHWDGRTDTGEPVVSGVYVLQARLGSDVRTRRITVLR